MATDLPKDNDEIRTKYFETKKKEFEDGCNTENKDQGDACFCLAEWYQVVAKDISKSSAMFSENCFTRNNHRSCYNLAMQLLSDKGEQLALDNLPADKKPLRKDSTMLARSLLKNACEVGEHPMACLTYASMCMSGMGGEKETQNGLSLLQKLCFQGNDGRACVKLGTAYLRGTSVPKDTKLGFESMKQACDELGHPNGCQVLAVMYNKGETGVVEVDKEKSKYYQALTKELLVKTGESLGSVHVNPT